MGVGSWVRAAACLAMAGCAAPALAAEAPSEIKIGALYAGSGQLASASMPLHSALEMWADGVNKDGGVFVHGFNKKIPVRIIGYDDQSSPSLAGNLTNQLITRDKVDILLSDSTSVMTASAVPVARDHKMLLWDVTGSSPNFFTPDNPYIVLLGLAATDRYPKTVADFMGQMPKLGAKTVAILYNTADYTSFQAIAVRKAVAATPGLKLVFDRGVPANTTDYTLLVNNIAALKPDAVFEFGYPANEIAFLHALQDNDTKFPFLFTAYGLTELPLMRTNGLSEQVKYSYALASSAVYEFKVDYGMNLDQFREAFEHWLTVRHQPGIEFGYNALAGYLAGIMIEKTLSVADNLDQLELRRAIFTLSGHLNTIAGPFLLAPDGSQSGEILPLGQIVPGTTLDKEFGLNIVWPAELATAKPVYPAP